MKGTDFDKPCNQYLSAKVTYTVTSVVNVTGAMFYETTVNVNGELQVIFLASFCNQPHSLLTLRNWS
uniref:Uncharacterized protein n=1 Tax=Anguilla anguilla TaxID=7936 RepID=A0A0E9UCJ6_ANGAN